MTFSSESFKGMDNNLRTPSVSSMGLRSSRCRFSINAICQASSLSNSFTIAGTSVNPISFAAQ